MYEVNALGIRYGAAAATVRALGRTGQFGGRVTTTFMMRMLAADRMREAGDALEQAHADMLAAARASGGVRRRRVFA